MTVAEIKEYIDIKLNKYAKDKDEGYFIPLDNYYSTLIEIKSMLDDLEPKAEWKFIKSKNYPKPMKISQWYKCSNCETISEHQTKFCCYCGAKMKPYKENNK